MTLIFEAKALEHQNKTRPDARPIKTDLIAVLFIFKSPIRISVSDAVFESVNCKRRANETVWDY